MPSSWRLGPPRLYPLLRGLGGVICQIERQLCVRLIDDVVRYQARKPFGVAVDATIDADELGREGAQVIEATRLVNSSFSWSEASASRLGDQRC